MAFIDNVKQWFKTNDKPTQGQFYSWMNWLRWKDEVLAITEITGLQAALNALGTPIQKFEATGLFTYVIPQGYLVEWVHIKPTTDCTVQLDNGNGFVTDVDVVASHGEPIVCMYAAGIDRTITIIGLPLKTLIYIKRYLLPI